MEEGQQSYLVNEKNWSPWVDNKCLEAPFTSETPSHMMSEGSTIMIGEDKCPSDQEEKFGDSLHQLNKIVERISPDSSGVGYPNFNQHHKLNNLTNRTRPSFASSFTESMGDSAYETFAGDNSYDCSNEGQFVDHHHRGISEPYIDPRNHSQWQHSLNEWQQDPRSNMIKVPSVNNLYQKTGDVYSSHLVDQGHQIMGNGINYSSYDSNKISKPECLTREFSFSEEHHKSLYNYTTDKNVGRKQGRSSENQYNDLSGREFRYGSSNEFEHEKSISNWQLPGSKNFLEIGKYSTEDRSNSSKSYENFPTKGHGNLKSNQCSTERQVSSDCNLTSDSRNSSDEDDVKGDGDGNGRQTFSCSHCNFGASKKGQLRKHMSMHGVFLCAHCEFASEIAEVLEDHRRMSHPGLCGRKLCKKCRVLYQGDELEEHEKLCSGEKQHWTCPVCHKEFKFLSVMKAHARKWHPNETGILMSNNMMLGSASHQESSWRTSAADSTTGEMTPDNDSSRAPSSGEDFHSSAHFDGRRTCFIGSENKKVGLKKGMEQGFYKASHEKLGTVSMHTEDLASRGPSYNDDVCSAGETPPLEVPFFCDFENCCTTFRSDKELNVHRMSIHGLPPKRYHCRHPDCSMQFAKYGHYKRHQLSHAGGGEKKFKCDWPNCGKAFCHTDNLKVHYRRHTDEKPYKCDKCASSYRQKSGLKYHLEKAHDEKSTGRPGRKRKNLNAVEEPAHYSTSHKWESQEFQNFSNKEYNKNQESLKLPETTQLRYEQNYSAPSGNTGPSNKSMAGGFHSFYEQTDLQNLMKVKSYSTNQKNEMIKMDHHLGGWGGSVKPVHIDRVYQEPGNMVQNMRGINPLNNCSVDGKGGFNALERSQSNRHNFYLSKSSSYCNPQNQSNLSVNYIEEMSEGDNALTALPLMNKNNLESEMASSSEDEWTNYSQHIKPVGSRGSMHEEPIDEPMMEREHAGRREIDMVDIINKTSDLSDSKTTLTFEKDLVMSEAMVNSKNTFEKLPGEKDPDINKPDGDTECHSDVKSNQNLHDDSSENKLAEKPEEPVDASDNHEDQICLVRKSPDKSLSRNSPKCSRASSVERSEVSNAAFEALGESEEKSISSVDHSASKKAPDYYSSPGSHADKIDKSIESNPPNSPWRERSSQNNELCWPEAPQPHPEMGSFSSSKGWPRVLDASLTESHSSEANNAHKSLFESSENTSADDSFNRNADSCDKVRNPDRPPDISSFGAPNYQMLNDYPSSRHPLFNDNYCFSPSAAAANLSYGNVYNFSTNMRRAGSCLDAFSGPPFQAAERYGRGDDHDYRDPGLRIGSGYNSFLHSSPYPYDPRHYHAPENPLMPGSYDFSYSASTLPPFPPPPPPPSFSLTRPWTGHSDFDIISGSETLKSSSSHRLYQSPYGQSNSLNRYF